MKNKLWLAIFLALLVAVPVAYSAYRSDRVQLVGGPHATAAIQDASGATGAPILATKGYLLETFPVATGVLSGATNAIWLGVDSIAGDTGCVIYEGSAKNAYETRVCVVNPTADVKYLWPNNTAGTYYPISSASITTGNTLSTAELALLEEPSLDALAGLTISATEYGYLESAPITALAGLTVDATEFGYLEGIGVTQLAGATTMTSAKFNYLNTASIASLAGAPTVSFPAGITGAFVPIIIKNDIAQVADGASATLTAGSTISIPAALWTTGASVGVACGGTLSGTAAVKTIAVTVEGTTVFSTVSQTADVGDWIFRGSVFYASSTTSKGAGAVEYATTYHSAVDQGTTGTETVAGTIDFSVIISTNKTAGGLTKEECTWTFRP